MDPRGVCPRLMLVTDRARVRGAGLLQQIEAAIRGGVGLVQVREKDLCDEELESLARAVLAIAPEGARICINGRPALARRLGVGLHLPAAAPHLRPHPQRPHPFGRSTHSVEEAALALEDCPSYLVLGTIFPTACKPGHPGSGVSLVDAVARRSAGTPIYCIGGITPSRVARCLDAGAYGVAVCSAILASPEPQRVAADFVQALRHRSPTGVLKVQGGTE